MSAQAVTWNDGGNGLQRQVSTEAASDVILTASVNGANASAVIHVIAAAQPPGSNPAAPQTPEDGGYHEPTSRIRSTERFGMGLRRSRELAWRHEASGEERPWV